MANHNRKYDYTKIDHLLGKRLDSELATIVGCSVSQICARRNKLNIRPFHGRRPHYDHDSIKHLYGIITDRGIAALIGCTPSAICQRRKRLKIDKSPNGRIPFDQYKFFLGAMPDAELAEFVGLSTHRIRILRQRYGIKSMNVGEHKCVVCGNNYLRIRQCQKACGGRCHVVWGNTARYKTKHINVSLKDINLRRALALTKIMSDEIRQRKKGVGNE